MKALFMRLRQFLLKKKPKLDVAIIVRGYSMANFVTRNRILSVKGNVGPEPKVDVPRKVLAHADLCIDQCLKNHTTTKALRSYFCPYISVMDENVMFDSEFSDWGFGAQNIKMPNGYGHQWLDLHTPMNKTILEHAQKLCLSKKQKFCAFVFSNSTPRVRNRLYELLSRHRRVDALGDVLRNTPLASTRYQRGWQKDLTRLYRPYKFMIAFENSVGKYYVTEKIGSGFACGTVPIYWGCPNIAECYNPDSFINAYDFESLEALAKYIIKVDTDDSLYKRYLAAQVMTQAQISRSKEVHKSQKEAIAEYAGTVGSVVQLPNMQANSFLREIISRLKRDPADMIVAYRRKLMSVYRVRQVLWPYR